MNFTDRDSQRFDGRGGGFGQVFGRIFGDTENPLGWALPLGSVARIRVRIHLLFIVYAVAQLLWSIPRGNAGVGYTAIAIGVLFVVVLLHEFGHCFSCRAIGGEADEIMMWPLGGLAFCAPPETWRANLLTTLGGPAVNVLIAPLTTGALVALGHGDTALFNPFQPIVTLGAFGSWWLVALWWTHYINLLILAFNILLPMYPMDGGRALHAILWRSMGRRRAMQVTTVVGFATAGVVGVFSLVADQTMLLGIAIMGGAVCWLERQRLRMETDPGLESWSADAGADDEPPPTPSRRQQSKAIKEARQQAEVDRILAKIAEQGIKSLTKKERGVLRRETQRSRQE